MAANKPNPAPATVSDTHSAGFSHTHFDSDEDILEYIIDEFTLQIRSGQSPSIAHYQQKYPHLHDELEEMLSSVAMIEQLKSDGSLNSENRRLLDQVSQLTQIGSYKIVREVGRGGMGVVFEAIHQSLGRRVALKVMPTPLTQSEKYLQRFSLEAQAAAKLHHTNIVSVYGMGEQEGFHYYVMDLIDGQSLSEIISDRNQTGTQSKAEPDGQLQLSQPEYYQWAAQIGANIADALSYAHDFNILHRDIKPGNIILDQKGIAWITDFGLAKDSSLELNLTKTGDVIGTPQYLAPESLEGDYHWQSEIYCLGITLYELVTLQPAYPCGSTAEIIRAIASSSPSPARQLNPNIPLDLSTVISKAIAREPSTRHASIAEFRDDLLAFIDDRPITARRPRFYENIMRWSRHNPLVASLSAVSLLLLSLVAVSATIGYLATTNALNQEAKKTAQLEAQQIITKQAQADTEHHFDLMKIQYDRAEANLAMTIDAFDAIFHQIISRGSIQDGGLDVVGFRELTGVETSLTAEDAALLENLLPFYEKFACLNVNNERMKSESAKANRRVGNIYQLAGDIPAAIRAYKRSVEAYQTLYSDSMDSQETLLDLVQTMNELSSASRKTGDHLQAHQWNKKSVELLDASPLSQTEPDVRLELARTLSAMGFNLFQNSSLVSHNGPPGKRRGRKPPGRGQGHIKDLPPSKHSPPPHRQFRNLIRRGTANPVRRGAARQHLLANEQAIEILDELISESPERAEYISARATCHCVLAVVKLRINRSQGIQIRDQAIADFETLIKQHPENSEYQYLLALACALSSKEYHTDDIPLIQRATEIATQLVDQYPNVLDYHHLFVSLKIKSAHAKIRDQQPDSALEELLTAKNSIEQLIDHAPSDRLFRQTFMALNRELRQIAMIFDEKGQQQKSKKAKQLSRQFRSKISNKQKPKPQLDKPDKKTGNELPVGF